MARERQVVSVRMVEAYVIRVLTKLGLDWRVQIATWAIAHGLGPPGDPWPWPGPNQRERQRRVRWPSRS
jgi:hypothetical protein